jgi:hypothetical protein
MSKVSHSKGWSTSTAIKQENSAPISENEHRDVSTGAGTNTDDGTLRRPVRRSILQRFTGLGSPGKPGARAEGGSRLCGSLVKFKLEKNPCDVNLEGKDNSDTAQVAGAPIDATTQVDGSRTEEKTSSQPELNSVVTVFHHKESSCYEVVTFDINNNTELNRMYVPAEEVNHHLLAEKKKRRGRMSFMGGAQAAEKKLSIKFSELMVFTLDHNQQLCVDILKPDVKNPSKEQYNCII